MKIGFRNVLVVSTLLMYLSSFSQSGLINQISLIEPTLLDRVLLEDSTSQVAIECDFSKHKFNSEKIKDLRSKVADIISVKLVYTRFRDKPEFDQVSLNRNRLHDLNKFLPGIIENYHIRWELIEQTGCNSIDSCKGFFHGFLIDFRKEFSKEDYGEEITYLKKVIVGKDPEKREDKAGFLDAMPRYEGACVALKRDVLEILNKVGGARSYRENLEFDLTITISSSGELENLWITGISDEFINSVLHRDLKKINKWTPGDEYGFPVSGTVNLTFKYDFKSKLLIGDCGFLRDKEELRFPKPDKYFIENRTVLELLKEDDSERIGIAVDVTGSMSPYVVQTLIWLRESINSEKTETILFFNDGNYTADYFKRIGETGGLYSVSEVRDFDSIIETLIKSMVSGNGGGDIPENNVEALLETQRSCDGCTNLVMIADNYATPRDLSLAKRIDLPVKIILCGGEELLNPAYLNLARSTMGSVHLANQSYDDLHLMSLGDKIEYKDFTYTLTADGFRLEFNKY